MKINFRLKKKNKLSKFFLFYYNFRIKLLEMQCKYFKKSFYCNSLRGNSSYNIVINSDMSVSCNCNDFLGLGKIGSLNDRSFEKIFYGKEANSLRKTLSKGKIPIFNCIVCPDLRIINNKQYLITEQTTKLPKGIMIENTINCNLNCLSCNRDIINSNRNKPNMSLEDIKKISLIINKNKINSLSFFNLGEPFYSNDIKQELELLKKINPDLFIAISTNGMFLDSNNKKEAALIADYINFSIHGSNQESAEKYQKKINFLRTYNNMKKLVELRDSLNIKKPKIVWKYVLFNWNDSKKEVINAIRLAKEAKIDEIIFEITTSPILGTSYKYYFGNGYLKKFGKFENKILKIKIR